MLTLTRGRTAQRRGPCTSPPRVARRRVATVCITVLVALALSACGALRVAYGQAPSLAYWWADRYVDFNGAQTALMRRALDQWMDWHRRDQLGAIAKVLRQSSLIATREPGPEQVCAWFREAQGWRDAAFEQALPALAQLALSLSPEQWRHIEQQQRKSNETFRDDFLQPDPEDRLDTAVDRTETRIELLYGSVDAQQRAVLTDWVRQSPFDPDRWFKERQRRQSDLMQVLRGLQSAQGVRVPPTQAESALRGWWQRVDPSPDDSYRRYNENLVNYNCRFAAEFHKLTTPTQRRHAADRLRSWEQDLTTFIPGRD